MPNYFPVFFFFFFNDTATTEIYTLSLHDALPIYPIGPPRLFWSVTGEEPFVLSPDAKLPIELEEARAKQRSEEHTSELQSLRHLVCRLLLEKKNNLQHRLPHAAQSARPDGRERR